MKKILTVAGSDSSGGAGIQADLKTITLMGEYGLSVITALTAQNTQGVFGIYPVPLDFISSQWEAIVSDIEIDAIKTGMLGDEKVISLICQKIKKSKIPIRVFDPVMVAKSGASLLTPSGRKALVKELLPLATIITPNIPEAQIICGFSIRTEEDMKKSAQKIYQLGAKNVLIKGGHKKGKAVDVLYDGKEFFLFSHPRIDTIHTHGTGCTLASAIAVELARNTPVPEAVEKAKEFITSAIRYAFPLGKGRGPTNPYFLFSREKEIYLAIESLQKAIKKLQSYSVGSLIPEVQSNLGYAIPFAKSVEDVVAFPGRIIRVKDTILVPLPPEPGGSNHIARIILTVMNFAPEYRSAMNIRYSPELIQKCRKQNWKIKKFDRQKEPDKIKLKEGASLEWGISSILQNQSHIPDVIYDQGDVGKEPMIRILGKNPEEVVDKILCLL